ncbi:MULTISPECIES: class I SAM-dependent methyltransferase [unclassified Sphingomonas]|jgi:23S rRNA (cytosine1962-C5)-methyltransferase|uniref:class I SAM-dependent methyltransferase n=1 Tax=unclassified Sphingomonas TaxID=196159 RepID=UPI0008303F37|nr:MULTISPECIES: class I SAM-dependent methyltransferase [unclassified Sphingomonas]
MSGLPPLVTMIGEPWADYGLVDSGHGRKLERYGPHRFIRPEPQAMWAPASAEWSADAEFLPGADEDGGGRWQFDRPVPRDGWTLGWEDVRFNAQPTPFRHLGFFPDMAPVWTWMRGQLLANGAGPLPHPATHQDTQVGGRVGERAGTALAQQPECLNLFGYTGVGTLALSAAGARMVHVDASKKSVDAARGNAALSGLADKPIRWLVEDAGKFTAREVRRGRRYDGIILDPPKWGRGPNGEVWKLEEHLAGMIGDVARLVDAESRFIFLTVYAVRMSALAIGELLAQATAHLGGTVEAGELGVREEARGLVLPTAIFARWSRG